MQVQVTTIRGKKWAVGLEWEIMSDGTVAEAKDFAKRAGATFGIFAECEGVAAVGLTKTKIKCDSAAYYLMLANQEARLNNPNDLTPDWIVIEEVDEDRYWMGVIREGLPAPQYDKIFDITTMKNHFTELVKSESYVIYSTCREIVDLFADVKEVREKGLNELTEHIDEKIKSVKLKGIPDKYIYLGISIAALVGATWGLSTFIEGKNLKEKTEALNKRRIAQERQIQQEYENAMIQYEQTLKALDKATKDTVLYGLSGTPDKIISAWFDEISNYRVGSHGWKLANIECYYNPVLPDTSALTGKLPEVHSGVVLGCDYLYSRTGFATNRMLLQEYPEARIAGNMALVTKKLDVDSKYLIPPTESALQTLPAAQNWGFDMISQLQLLKIVGIDHTVSHSADITYTAPSKPLTPEQKKNGDKPNRGGVISTGYAKGDLVLKSKNLELLKEVADNVDFKAVGVKSVKLKIGTFAIVSWELLANYYVNSKAGGVVAADSASVQPLVPDASQNGQAVGGQQAVNGQQVNGTGQ